MRYFREKMIYLKLNRLKGMMKIEERDEVKSVIKGFQLLEIISEVGSIGLTELSRKSGLKKTTVYRLLETLKTIGLIDQDKSTQQFFLTLKIVTLSTRVLENLDLRRVSRPFMEKFVRDHGETILLTTLEKDLIVTVDRIRGIERFLVKSSIGDKESPHCTASGKAILAFLPLEQRRSLVGNDTFTKYTSSTITDWPTLEKDLNNVRQRGFGLDLNERFADIVAVAVPLLNHKGMAVGAVTMLRVTSTIDQTSLLDLGKQLIELGRDISFRLGWTGIVSADDYQ